MRNTLTYQAEKYQNDSIQKVEDSLVVEESLLINVNFKPFTLTMRSPGREEELVRGLLFTENIISINTPYTYKITEKKNGVITAVNVVVEEKYIRTDVLDKRNLLSVSSCGICGKLELNDIVEGQKPMQTNQTLKINDVFKMFSVMDEHQEIYKKTGATHSAAVFDNNHKMLACFEDIGRHNAVDKVIGHLLLTNTIEEAVYMTYSGRVSYEIITKIYMAGIPFLAAVSAPSSLSVELSEDLGITLLAFCRGNKATCYTNSERIEV